MHSLGCMSVRQSRLEHFLEILTCRHQWRRLIKGNKRLVARRFQCAEQTKAANLQTAKSALCFAPARLPLPPTKTLFLFLVWFSRFSTTYFSYDLECPALFPPSLISNNYVSCKVYLKRHTFSINLPYCPQIEVIFLLWTPKHLCALFLHQS